MRAPYNASAVDWKQEATGKECGLHSGNIVQSAVDQAHEEATRDLWDADANVETLSKEQLGGLLHGSRDKHTLVVLYAPWCQFSQVWKASWRLWSAPSLAVHAPA